MHSYSGGGSGEVRREEEEGARTRLGALSNMFDITCLVGEGRTGEEKMLSSTKMH